MRDPSQLRTTDSIVFPSICPYHRRPGRRRQRPRVMVGGTLLLWWSAVGLLMSCRASPSHARRHHRPPHHRLQDGRCADSASCCRGGLTCAAFALPRLSTTVACSSPRRQNALDSLGDARRICGGDRSMSSHVNCGRNSFCDKATTGAPGGENGRKSKLPPSMLLYGAAIHWLSSNRRTGSPATASLQSTHEQIAVDNGELNSSSSTRAAAAASATASEFSSSKQQQQARQAASPAGTDTTLLASSSSSSSHFLGVNGSENKKKRSEELEQETSISLSSDDTLGVTTGKTKTPNGGHCHTPESRGKISAANKGKTPWNKGGNHSEETRRKIAEGAREAARRRKVAMATAMGLSVEEYEKVKRRERNTRTEPGEGTTQETRSKISARLRERWKDPVYRQARLSTMPKRQGVKHSEETKQRIRQAVTLKWNDPEYREKITSRVSTEETRKKIGQVIRDQWADPNIRKERMANMSPKSEEHRKRIAASVKAKWADPDYRARTVERMKASSQARTIATGKVPKPKRIPQPRVPRPPRPPREPRAKRSPRSTMAKWTVMGRKVEAQLERENKRAEKMKAAEEKLKAKQAKLEAERLAKEEEDRLVAGMDELDALLYRQNLRVQAHSQQAEESADTVGDEEVEWGEEEEYYDPDDEYELLARPKRRSRAKKTATPGEGEEVEGVDVPEGFKMVMQNGRMVLRMR